MITNTVYSATNFFVYVNTKTNRMTKTDVLAATLPMSISDAKATTITSNLNARGFRR